MFQLHFSKQEEFATFLEIVLRKIVTKNTHRSDYLHIWFKLKIFFNVRKTYITRIKIPKATQLKRS